MCYAVGVRWIGSARRHVDPEDFYPVAEHPVVSIQIREDPLVEMRLGFDRSGRALEVGCELGPSGWVIFHANKITPAYLPLLKRGL